ncbi:hypothetical protein HNQ78_000180 [Phycisphaera mikurensis]|nr:hypothetical protein [Phycisphaera mikurensis]MBB6440459.1 hypothetical protein [Phycisphaera mikurensis]
MPTELIHPIGRGCEVVNSEERQENCMLVAAMQASLDAGSLKVALVAVPHRVERPAKEFPEKVTATACIIRPYLKVGNVSSHIDAA